MYRFLVKLNVILNDKVIFSYICLLVCRTVRPRNGLESVTCGRLDASQKIAERPD